MDPFESSAEQFLQPTPPLPPPPRSSFLGTTFKAFSHRNFRLFFIGQLISLIGGWMNSTAIGWLVYQITGSKALLGVVAATSMAPMIVLSTLGGWMADRFSKRNILVATQVASMVLAFVLAALVWHGSVKPWQLIVLSTIGGIIMGFDMPARQTFVIEMTSREDLVNAISLNSAAFNTARIVGPSVAGVLMAKVGIAACFFIDGVSYLAVIAGLLMMRLAPLEPNGSKESALEEVFAGFRYVGRSPTLKRIFFLFIVLGIFGMSYSVLMPAIALDVLKVSESSYGALLAANGFGALVGALTVAALGSSVSPRKLAFRGAWTFVASLFLFAFCTSYWLSLVLLAIIGFGMILFFACVNSAIQLYVTDEMRGRVMGIWSLAFGAIVPLGSLEAGVISQYFGTMTAISAGAVLCAVGIIAAYIQLQKSEAKAAEASLP